MTTLNFPANPVAGQTTEGNLSNGLQYTYDGVKWTSQGSYATGLKDIIKLDNITSQFNGSLTTFNLTATINNISVGVNPLNAESLIISLGGVIQEPQTAYTVNTPAGTITFASAPATGTTFFGILQSRLPTTQASSTLGDGAVTTAKVNSIDSTKLSFTQAGTGATARTVDSKLKDSVSVKDFGATGDGTTDDLAAIHAAIATGAAEIFFPKGTYRISSQLQASSAGQRLIGVGAETIIKPLDSGWPVLSTSVVRQTSTNCTIEKIRVEGNSSNLTTGSTVSATYSRAVNNDVTKTGKYSQSGTTVTISIPKGHGVAVGDLLTINYTSGTATDDTFSVASVAKEDGTTTASNVFTVTAASSATTSGTVTIKFHNKITITKTGHGLATNDAIVANFTAGGATNGTYTITKVDNDNFTLLEPVSGNINAGTALTYTKRLKVFGITAFNTVIDCEVNNTSNYAIVSNDKSNVLIKGCKVTNTESGYGIWCQNTSTNASLSDITIEDNLVDMSHVNPKISKQVCALVRGRSKVFTINQANINESTDANPNVLTSTDEDGNPTAHNLNNGDTLRYFSKSGTQLVTSAGTVADGTVFYVVVETDNTFKLSSTKGGTALEITNDGNNNQEFIKTYSTKDVRIEGNTFIQCTNPTNSTPLGVEVRFIEGGVIANNHSLDGSMLCSVAGSKFVTVDGNVCNNATYYGIEVAGLTNETDPCEDVVVSNNTINGGGILNQGIALQGKGDNVRCTVSGNTVHNCVEHGIFVFAAGTGVTWQFVTITGNNVFQSAGSNWSTVGIYNANTNYVTVTGNVVSGTAGNGMFFNSSSNLAISGNTLSGPTTGIALYAVAVEMNYITISGNIFASTVTATVTTTAVSGGSFGNYITVMGSPDFSKSATGTTALDLSNQVYDSWGTTATPHGNIAAGIGSTFRKTDSTGVGNTLWLKESGTDNSGWEKVTTSPHDGQSVAGTGSAGAGKQYIPLNFNGSTYKVLHDGTV